jgi:[ribosomal protein S5]-alanine N-acetyltransferase
MHFDYITTKRLQLRKLTPETYTYLFTHYTEEEIKAFFGFKTEDDFLKERGRYEKGVSTFNKSFTTFQIIDTASQKLIGSCGFHTWYTDHKRAEIGYALTHEDFKRKGIMTEAMAPILQYGFEQMSLHRIEAFVSPDNIPSLKLMETFKFTKEGHLREHYFNDGVVEDSLVFSLLRAEYYH